MLWLDGAINGAGRLSIMQGRAVAFNIMSWFNEDRLSVKMLSLFAYWKVDAVNWT